MKNLFLIISCFVSTFAFAQVEFDYKELIHKADSLYEYKDYISAKYYYQRVQLLDPSDKWSKDKLEICNIYFEKFKENLQYCRYDSIMPKTVVYLLKEKNNFSDIPFGYVHLFNEINQPIFCGYFSDGKFQHGLKFYYDSIWPLGNLPFITAAEKIVDGNVIGLCQQMPTDDTVRVYQWYNVYGKMWKQTNSPFQPKINYYILKTYKRNMVGQIYEYHYSSVGMVDTIAYHYWEKYKYDTLGRQIEIVKTNGGADSTKIILHYDKENNLKLKFVIEYGYEEFTTKDYVYILNKEGILEEKLMSKITTKNKR